MKTGNFVALTVILVNHAADEKLEKTSFLPSPSRAKKGLRKESIKNLASVERNILKVLILETIQLWTSHIR